MQQVVVVPGGTGNVGEGIVRAFAGAGARVVVPSRSAARIDELKARLDDKLATRVIGAPGDTSSFAGMRALAEEIVRDVGPVDHVVSSMGGWWQGGRVWELTEAEFQRHFVTLSALQFSAARAFVPLMRDGGSFAFIVGLSAIIPIPGASPMGMFGGAQLMLARVLQAEVAERLRVNSLMLGPVISRSRPTGRAEWLSADEVGDGAVRLSQSAIRNRLIRLDDRNVARKSYEELGL